MADNFTSKYNCFSMTPKYKSNKIYYQSTIMLAGPVVISQLGHTLRANSRFHHCGTISRNYISGSRITGSFGFYGRIGYWIRNSLWSNSFNCAGNGKSNDEECAKLLSNSLWLNFIAAMLLFLLVYYGSMFAMNHVDQDPRVVETAKPYLLLLGISILPLMLFQTFK